MEARSGEMVGRVEDIIVRLRGVDSYPLVTGIVAGVGGRRVFVGSGSVQRYGPDRILLATNEVDLRRFERREGEVLLRGDVLGHRLIDVAAGELVRAYDVELDSSKESSHIAGRGPFSSRPSPAPCRSTARPENTVVAACGAWLRHLLAESSHTLAGRLAVSAGPVSGEAIGSVAADGSAKRTGAATAAVLARRA
ncbi:hypothetical protein A9W98_09945 [Mycobacterium gordonae]|uniref:PRC-barrel domain-containing protein n=1 Tax=Mycobacterium gordonae TaxID=1778 RepID=A0A1A6BLZ4_MYCGO|nr:hypothetical protein A9W98_09945 [Mycobacterium gordonae]